MLIREVTLELGMRALVPVVRILSGSQPKLRRGVAGADQAVAAMRDWAQQRDRSRPLLWLHAPSVGEALMAQAILQQLDQARPELQTYFTHLSPSAERMRERVGADGAGYLPWDTPAAMQAALAALQPAALAFVRTEIWPTLCRVAHERGVPVLLLNAVLPAGSSRLRPLARFALRPAHQRLSGVGAINQAAAARFPLLGVPAGNVHVTGDARFDQVWSRVSAIDAHAPLLQNLRDPRFTIVAGSTWPADEIHLLPAFKTLLQQVPARLIIAPHEPTQAALQRIENTALQAGLTSSRLSALERGAQIVLIDRMGVLADLYLLADIAFVGGAFHKAGVHSVVEPAALGVPVVIGPDHANAAEAQELIDAGGAFSIRDGAALQNIVLQLHGNREQRRASGEAARAFVQSRLGAARANAGLVLAALDSRQHDK